MIKDEIFGKRLLAIDFGMRRIGVAVCDALHIAVHPVGTIINDETMPDNLQKIIDQEQPKICIIGVPVRNDDKNDKLIAEIKKFAKEICNETFGLDVYFQDEFMSSKKASETMVKIGKKKSKRAEKGALDKVAAAIILTEFLAENEG